MSPPRLRLLVVDWPAEDQQAWSQALATGSLFDEGGAAAWSTASRNTVEKAYGLWLACLKTSGQLDVDAAPLERVNRVTLEGYLASLEGKKPSTIANRFRDLLEALRVLVPDGDTEELRRITRALQARARQQVRVEPNLVSPDQLYEAGIARMERVAVATYEKLDVQAVQFGDGLMMAMLAIKAVRRRNIARTVLGVNLVKQGEVYHWRFGAHETKTRKSVSADLPERLTPYIEVWLNVFRPVLVRDRECDTLWVSCYRQPMAESTITARFKQATEDELGVAISPHKVRHAIATGVAAAMPSQANMIPYLLDHAGDQVLRKHYLFARNLAASEAYLNVLEDRQGRARGQ